MIVSTNATQFSIRTSKFFIAATAVRSMSDKIMQPILILHLFLTSLSPTLLVSLDRSGTLVFFAKFSCKLIYFYETSESQSLQTQLCCTLIQSVRVKFLGSEQSMTSNCCRCMILHDNTWQLQLCIVTAYSRCQDISTFKQMIDCWRTIFVSLSFSEQLVYNQCNDNYKKESKI